ncbi:MAG TPA: hypothetical protein VGF48_09900 [Thermoanaerobaculia bacterium]|jgi:hypothetical protein
MTSGAASDDLDIRPEVAHRLGHYVYLYIDPRTQQPFYVGKGKGERALSHLSEAAESRKCVRLAELAAEGKKPRIDILAHGLRDEETAFRIEAAIIDLFGLDTLTNEVRGWRSLQLGRIPLSELTMYYAATPVEVDVPALLIRINRLYRHNMTPQELYEATRGVWKLGPRCTKARYAFAVFEGLVREVYEIESWHVAGTTAYATRDASQLKSAGRREFFGRVAEAAIRDRYVGRSVADYFHPGQQNPVVYVNC